MNTQLFLEKILGDEGYYCILGLAQDKVVQKFYTKLQDVIKVAENFKENGYDAYYALATFEDAKSRMARNVKQLRSLFLDLDCGADKPYANHAEALVALRKFCKDIKLPKPTIVNSGGGIHAYWAFTEPISREEWLPVAKKFKKLCDECDLQIDRAVPADAARILRIPGTLNFKLETPRDVSIIGELAESLPFSFFKGIIGEVVEAEKTYIPRGEMDEVTKSILGNFTNKFKTIIVKTIAGEGCKQLEYIIKNQATMNEPMWRAGLSIAKFCVDADTAMHKISAGYPDYTPEGTEKKLMGIKGGPYTCVKFEEYNPGGCEGCPNKGNVKSPIVLGREVQEASEQDNIVEDTVYGIDQGHTQTYVIPKYPEPYFRPKNGGVCKRIIKQGDEIEVMIYHNDLYVTRRLMDSDLGEAAVVRLHLPKDGVREYTVPLSAITSKDEFRKHMSTKGVAVIKMDQIMSYVNTWVNEMQFKVKADVARRQFGWTDSEKFESCVVGDKEVYADRIDHNPPSMATAKMIRETFISKGTLDGWKETMEFYNKPNMELHQFVIGLGFGSIFSAFTPINGAVLHIHSKESGLGKTTAMFAAASIWGDPGSLVLKENDTANSKLNRVELHKNLPVFIDEVTNSIPMALSNFVYNFTSGSQPNRMSSGSNQERIRGANWKTTCTTTGNTSMLERIAAYKAMPKAEAARVLEVKAHEVVGLSKAEGDEFSERINNNYGHAYIPFLQYVMNDVPGMRALYKQTQLIIDKKAEFKNPDRFHSVLITDAIMGLMIAKKVGLISYDIKPVLAWALLKAKESQTTLNELDIDAEGILTSYWAENYTNVLRIKSTDDARNPTSGVDHLVVPDGSPRATFVMRYEYDIKMLYLFMAPLKSWCVKQQINYSGFIEALKKGRTKAKIDKKRMGKGTNNNLPSHSVLFVDCIDFMEDDAEIPKINSIEI